MYGNLKVRLKLACNSLNLSYFLEIEPIVANLPMLNVQPHKSPEANAADTPQSSIDHHSNDFVGTNDDRNLFQYCKDKDLNDKCMMYFTVNNDERFVISELNLH